MAKQRILLRVFIFVAFMALVFHEAPFVKASMETDCERKFFDDLFITIGWKSPCDYKILKYHYIAKYISKIISIFQNSILY